MPAGWLRWPAWLRGRPYFARFCGVSAIGPLVTVVGCDVWPAAVWALIAGAGGWSATDGAAAPSAGIVAADGWPWAVAVTAKVAVSMAANEIRESMYL